MSLVARPEQEFSIHDVASREDYRYNLSCKDGMPDPRLLFMIHNEQLPTQRVIRDIIPGDWVIDEFIAQFGIDEPNIILDFEYLKDQSRFRKRSGILMVQKNIIVSFDLVLPEPSLRVYYSHSSYLSLVEEVCDFFRERITSCIRQFGTAAVNM